jgi:hypothetical protein
MKQKKIIIILAVCFLAVTVLVVALYAISDKIVHEPGSFLRVYHKGAAVMSNELDLGYNSYYIAGITDDHIYFGNLTNPLHLVITNLSLTDSQHVRIKLRNMENKPVYKGMKIRIAPPYFYYADGLTPGLYRGKLGDWQAERFMFDSAFFDRAEIIGPSTFAIRTHNTSLENVLGKVMNADPHIELAPDLLQKQVDGIFCTDGMLRYNKTLNRLIYTYYYRNEYIVYDTNLNLDYRGHTIDTFSHAQIKTAYISSTDTHTLTNRTITNRESSTSGNYLYIDSDLLAKNDFKITYNLMSVIDVYDLRNNKYKFSFSVLKFDATQTKFREFQVHNNRFLIALFDKYVVKYDLHSYYFKDDV